MTATPDWEARALAAEAEIERLRKYADAVCDHATHLIGDAMRTHAATHADLAAAQYRIDAAETIARQQMAACDVLRGERDALAAIVRAVSADVQWCPDRCGDCAECVAVDAAEQWAERNPEAAT